MLKTHDRHCTAMSSTHRNADGDPTGEVRKRRRVTDVVAEAHAAPKTNGSGIPAVIMAAGRKLSMSPLAISTAMVFFHRFKQYQFDGIADSVSLTP